MKMKRVDTRRMVLLAMLSGILLVMSFTPLGYLNIGPLAISLNMIPVAIGAAALGPGGGAFLGAVFVFVIAIIINMMDKTIKGEKDFSANYDIPILGNIPNFKTAAREEKK